MIMVTISLNVTATLVAAMHAELVVNIEVMRAVKPLLVLDATVIVLVLLEDAATEDEDEEMLHLFRSIDEVYLLWWAFNRTGDV